MGDVLLAALGRYCLTFQESIYHPGEGTRVCTGRTKGHGFRLKESRFKLRVARLWNGLLREVVDALSLDVFKDSLDGALSNLG